MKLFTLALTAFAIALPVQAESVHGIFRVVKGDVKIKSANGGEAKPARLGDKVLPKDTIITGKESRAKIVMTDKNEINVSPESQVVFANYEFKPSENKKEVLIDVLYGKVRSKVNQKYDNTQNNKFQVRTPSAVAGVRGTDFLTSFSPATRATQIVTFEGSVQFGLPGVNGSIQNPVSVTPNTTATSVAGAPPAPPLPVPAGQMANFDLGTDAEKSPAPSNAPAPDQRAPAENAPEKSDGASRGPDSAPGTPAFSPVVDSDMPAGDTKAFNPLPPSLNAPVPTQPDVPKVNEQIRGAIQGGNTSLKVIIRNQ